MVAAGLALLLSALSPPPAAAACKRDQVKTSAGCKSRTDVSRAIKRRVRQFMAANDLNAAIVRVDTKGRNLVTTAQGDSAPGIPATTKMHFRIGAIAIPFEVNLLLQLVDEGVVSLDDPVGKYIPTLPNANLVTLRMLASMTSGYPDFLFNNKPTVEAIYANPFKQWTADELLNAAFALPTICAPGSCFYYAHANFLSLALALHAATGTSNAELLNKRVLQPLGLRQTQISEFPAMPAPVLQAWDAERGFYENSTGWSPSPTINGGITMSSTIGDVAKAARAIGTGELISSRSRREQFAPVPTAKPFPAFNQSLYYGLGMILSSGWQLQNPQLFGYAGVSGYLPSRKLTIALTTTMGPTAAAANGGQAYSQGLFTELADYLSPRNNPVFP